MPCCDKMKAEGKKMACCENAPAETPAADPHAGHDMNEAADHAGHAAGNQ